MQANTSQKLTVLLLTAFFLYACVATPVQDKVPETKTDSNLTTANKPLTHSSTSGSTLLNKTETERHQTPVTKPAATNANYQYPWLNNYKPEDALQNRITPPEGFERIPAAENTFAHYLRTLPLKPGSPQVLLFDSSPKYNQQAQFAVFNIDVGQEDLQQCADAVMRLRAEFLWATGQYSKIHFKFTSGHNALYSQWRQGYRPVVKGNSVNWVQRETAQNSGSYASFKQYLKQVFTFAGTLSLSKELQTVNAIQNIEPGNVFIKGGSPGHAVIVVDVAQNAAGEKVFLLAQSYMPAQEIHVLVNPNDATLSPWYSANFTGSLQTPEWTFAPGSLKKFADQ